MHKKCKEPYTVKSTTLIDKPFYDLNQTNVRSPSYLKEQNSSLIKKFPVLNN